MENSKEQLSQLELNIKALEKDGIKVKHMSGYHSKDGVIQLIILHLMMKRIPMEI